MSNPLSKINILLIEDKKPWVNILKNDLEKQFAEYVEDSIETADTYELALEKLSEKTYHLITLDLKIKGLAGNEFPGNNLFEIIRKEDSNNINSGLIVLTGYGTIENLINSIGTKYRVEKFLLKEKYNSDEFTESAKRAVFDCLIRKSHQREQKRTILNLSINGQGKFWEGDLKGIKVQKRNSLNPSISLDINNLLKESDFIQHEILSKAKGRWRLKTKKLGTEIYQKLTSHPQVSSLLTAALQEVRASNSYIHLQFTSPAKYLNLPLELMFNDDYLVFESIFTRRLSNIEFNPTSFLTFISHLHEKNLPLKVLVVGANLGDSELNCEQEAQDIGDLIKRNLKMLGINEAVKILVGRKDATYDRLVHTLENECHILHFAGHSNNLKTIPEDSPIHLYDRSIKAIDLKTLLKNKNTQFVFLNSCLGAKMGNKIGRGGYWGFMDSLVSSGISAVLGYRWVVEDNSAHLLSYYFYENLFRTFCPAQSLFFARKQASIEIGRDEDIWASLVLLMQNL